MKSRGRRWIVTLVAASALVVASAPSVGWADPIEDEGDTTGHRSTGTVVVAKQNASGMVKGVGTSTITVRNGTTIQQLKAQIAAKDKSEQRYIVANKDHQEKWSGAVVGGDQLQVTAENGADRFTYQLAIYDPHAKTRDGAYWNEDLYNKIDETVNASTPTFKDNYCNITDPKYAGLVRLVTETFYVGNQANNPANKTSPLVADSQDVWYYTDAINAAIKDCHESGGGIVVIPATGSRNANGAYYSGAITLLSNVNLHIETDAVVKFMRNKTNEYYPAVLTSYEGTDFYNFSPLIYALNQTNIAITGGGTLDGQEDMWNWRPWKKGYWGEPSVENKSLDAPYGENGILNQMNFEDVPITKRIFTDDGHMPSTIPVVDGDTVKYVPPPADAVAMKSTFRPHFIETNHSRNVLIEGVKIRNTPFWIVHPLNSENVLIRDLDIYSDKTKDFEATGWNNDDGTNPESCKNVVLERNRVTVSDDGAAIKAGRNVNGRLHRAPSENLIIRDSVYNNDNIGTYSAAISTGSEMSGGIRNVFIERNEFGGPGLALILKIKTNSYRGGAVENIYLRHSLLKMARSAMIQLDSNYSETVSFAKADIFNPTVRNIYVDDVNTAPTMTPGKTTFQFSSAASRSPVENVYYRNSVFYTTSTLQAAFSSNKNIKNLVVENVTYINPSTGVETVYDTTPLRLLDETAGVTGGEAVRLTAASIDNPDVINSVPARSFNIKGKIDLAAYPGFVEGGTVRIFVDRSSSAIPATLSPDGSFTSDTITVDDDQYWYRDRHYIAVNFFNGLNINTVVYQVAVDDCSSSPGDGRTPVRLTVQPVGDQFVAGKRTQVTATLTNEGSSGVALEDVRLNLATPHGWTVVPDAAQPFGRVAPGQTVRATWDVTPAVGQGSLSAKARYVDAAVGKAVSTCSPSIDAQVPSDLVRVVKPDKLNSPRAASVGAQYYVDRDVTITMLPDTLAGGVVIPGANDDKRLTGPADYLEFTLKRDATVYVAFDDRGKDTWWPAWLADQGFQRTDLTIDTTDAHFTVFAKRFAAGEVTLGPTAATSNSSSSYFTIVAE
ncbi:glycosyl hydrolase family 28 protein [Micromonospora sp. SL1-18]|uniref:glycosyl hydrolase family 28 protein n=1 Tax=Micromonospora sp. SL1-18 TaxID=3399128 RepID=UPI003A4E39F9